MARNRNSGFTIVELLVSISIIAILAILAIPNLLRSRTTANEATAVSNLKAYGSAQVTFQLTRAGHIAANSKAGPAGYCDNFRNLYYGNPRNNPTGILALINKQFADAFGRAPGSKAAPTNNTVVTPAPLPELYQGYLFAEAKELIDPAGSSSPFASIYALLGVPYLAGREGTHAYWLGIDGTVYSAVITAGTDYATSIEMSTPCSSTTTSTGWGGL